MSQDGKYIVHLQVPPVELLPLDGWTGRPLAQPATEPATEPAKLGKTSTQLYKQSSRLFQLAEALSSLEDAKAAVEDAHAKVQQLHQEEALSLDELEVVVDATGEVHESTKSLAGTIRDANFAQARKAARVNLGANLGAFFSSVTFAWGSGSLRSDLLR